MWWIYYLKTNFQQRNNGVMQIILLNIIVFIILLGIKIIGFIIGHERIYQYMVQQLYLSAVWSIFKYKLWTVFTYCFVHENFFPMLWSLLTLYIFGNIIRDYLGSKHFVILYILGGLVGAIFYLLLCNFFPSHVTVKKLIGPSPSIYAVMVGASMISPNFYVHLLLLGGVRIKYIVALLISVVLLSLVTEHAEDSFAQLGGILVGYLYSKKMGSNFSVWVCLRDLFS